MEETEVPLADENLHEKEEISEVKKKSRDKEEK
jgi:hypothetical protein